MRNRHYIFTRSGCRDFRAEERAARFRELVTAAGRWILAASLFVGLGFVSVVALFG